MAKVISTKYRLDRLNSTSQSYITLKVTDSVLVRLIVMVQMYTNNVSGGIRISKLSFKGL